MKKQTSKAVLLRLLSSSSLVSAMMISGVNAFKSGNIQRRVTAFSTVTGKHYHSTLSTPSQPRRSAKLYSPSLHLLHKRTIESRYLSWPTTQLFMSSDDDRSTSDQDDTQQEPKASYNIAALKKETTRLISRAHKKVGKVFVTTTDYCDTSHFTHYSWRYSHQAISKGNAENNPKFHWSRPVRLL